MYLSYCFKMGILPKRNPRKNTHPLLKSDLLQMDAIIAKTRLLCREHIGTADELASFRARLESEKEQLTF